MYKEGDTLAHYEIAALIGQGGMGQVYRAKDTRLMRTVALKVIHRSLQHYGTPSADFSTRVYREARAVASLNHPNVVAVFDIGEHDDVLFLCMEHVTGETLREFIGRPEISWSRRVRWLIDIARALGAAHRAGVIHRDIKPENVILRDDGVIKVLDFGIARRTPSEGEAAADTVTGAGVAGTPLYMSPEQIRAEPLDGRSDQFAWGILAYELLTGERPWVSTAQSNLPVLAAILSTPAPPLSQRAALPSAVEQTVMRALSKGREDRFATMDALADALEPHGTLVSERSETSLPPATRSMEPEAFAATTRVPTTVTSPEIPKLDGGNRSSRSKWFAAGGALALAAAVVVSFRPHPPSAPPKPPVYAQKYAISSNPEAANAFEQGKRLWADGAQSRAIHLFEEAATKDPTLALAHLYLALLTFAKEPMDAQRHFGAAFQYRYTLTAQEDQLLRAAEAYVKPSPDLDEWETRLLEATHKFPSDHVLFFFLGRAREATTLNGTSEGALATVQARAAYEKSLALAPTFLPAMDALAVLDSSVGRNAEALARLNQCLGISRLATSCLEHKIDLSMRAGDCNKAKDDAAGWTQIEADSADAQLTFAMTLAALGAPRPSVEEVLKQRWLLSPAEDRKKVQLDDQLALSLLDGRFDEAIRLARDIEADLPRHATRKEHADYAVRRALIHFENNRMNEAAEEASRFLARMEAYQAAPFDAEASIDFWEFLLRAGKISRADFQARRTQWLDAEKNRQARLGKGTSGQDTVWAKAFAVFVESKEEAEEALAMLPKYGPLTEPALAAPWYNFSVGKAFFWAGRIDEALLRLQRVANSCIALATPQLHTRANLFYARASEAHGDIDTAKRAYGVVLSRWSKPGTTSISAKIAKEHMLLIDRE
jgi:eukaryotic-like serine/threonine-protein kinase